MRIFWILFFLSFSWPAPALKGAIFDTSPLHLAYGGAGGASLKPDFSYLINPSILGYGKNQGSLLAYSMKSGWQTILLSFADQKAGFPVSVTFQREWHSQKEFSPLNRWSVSAGSRITSYFFLGMTARRDKAKGEESQWNGDVGALLRLGRQTALGVTLSEILIYESQNRRALNFGFYQGWTHFLNGRVDASFSRENEWIVRGGIETVLQKFFAFRLGGLWSFKEERALLSGGVGFYGPRLQFDYALQRDKTVFQHLVIAKLLF